MLDTTDGTDPKPLTHVNKAQPLLARAAVLGAGAWGTALACALQRGGMQTVLWARRAEVAEDIEKRHRNPGPLPGIALPPGLAASADLARAVRGAQLVVVAVPSSALRATARRAARAMAPGTLVLAASKGIEAGSGALMSEVLEDELGPAMATGSIAGPSFAHEVARGQSTLLTLAMPALERGHPQSTYVRRVAAGLEQPLARAGVTLEFTADAVGAQVGGALKNMIAIACGMATALGMGENARAGIITRGLDDMRRLTLAMGGRVETLLGSCGVGDLFLTASSEQSRNTRLGMRLASAGAGAQGDAGELAEGAVSVVSVQVLEREYDLRLNVAAAVRDVLEQRLAPEAALRRLLHESAAARPARPAASRPAAPREAEPAVPAWNLGYA